MVILTCFTSRFTRAIDGDFNCFVVRCNLRWNCTQGNCQGETFTCTSKITITSYISFWSCGQINSQLHEPATYTLDDTATGEAMEKVNFNSHIH